MVQDLKEEVLAYERLMLHVMGFNLYMDLPDYPSMIKKIKGGGVPGMMDCLLVWRSMD